MMTTNSINIPMLLTGERGSDGAHGKEEQLTLNAANQES